MHRERVVRLLLAGTLAGTLVMTAPGCASGDDVDPSQPAEPTGGWRTAGCEFSRPPHFTTVGSRRLPATPPRLAAAMERIDQTGRQRFADSFAGLEVDQVRVRVIVYRVPSVEFDVFLRNTAEDNCLVVRDAAHAVAELTEWHDRVVTDLPYWSAQGIHITTVGSRHDGVGVQIGTPDLAATRREFRSRYGEGAPLVLVEEGQVTPLSAGR